MRLACVKHAASVRSEPGSNSQVHLRPNHANPNLAIRINMTRTSTNRPNSTVDPINNPSLDRQQASFKAFVTHKKNTKRTSQIQPSIRSAHSQPKPQPNQSAVTMLAHDNNPWTPPTYPFLAYAVVKERNEAHRCVPLARNAPTVLFDGLAPQLGANLEG